MVEAGSGNVKTGALALTVAAADRPTSERENLAAPAAPFLGLLPVILNLHDRSCRNHLIRNRLSTNGYSSKYFAAVKQQGRGGSDKLEIREQP